jgi:hypothetical protein
MLEDKVLNDICEWEFEVDFMMYVCKHRKRIGVKEVMFAQMHQDWSLIEEMHNE